MPATWQVIDSSSTNAETFFMRWLSFRSPPPSMPKFGSVTAFQGSGGTSCRSDVRLPSSRVISLLTQVGKSSIFPSSRHGECDMPNSRALRDVFEPFAVSALTKRTCAQFCFVGKANIHPRYHVVIVSGRDKMSGRRIARHPRQHREPEGLDDQEGEGGDGACAIGDHAEEPGQGQAD